MASGTATVLLIDPDKDQFLVGIRGKDVQVYPGLPSLPGGFMEAKYGEPGVVVRGEFGYLESIIVNPGETLEQTAIREVKEECGIEIQESQLHLYHVCSEPGIDPRAHVINVCFYVVLNEEQISNVVAGDDLDAIEWWYIEPYTQQHYLEEPMAFNHNKLVTLGIQAYQRQLMLELYKIN